MRSGRLFAVLCLALLARCAAAETAAADDIRFCGGTGTVEDPKVYLIDDDARLTWKHFNDIREAGITERYEFREAGGEAGEPLYAWTLEPGELNAAAEGPYFLGVRFYGGAETAALPFGNDAFCFSLATKRNFPGRLKLRLRVGDAFPEGTGLYLYYYGGYDSTVLHGSAPAPSADEILRIDEGFEEAATDIAVHGGVAEFYLRHGGNYFLRAERTAYSAAPVSAVPRYAPETVMGSARALFRAEGAAEAVAARAGKDADAALTQGDIDGIVDLYLGGLGLSDTKDLEAVYFAGLEGLTLSDNKLTELGTLSMPSLRRLDLSGNELVTVNGVVELEKLRDLILRDNKFTALPDLSALGALESLDLSGNALTAFRLSKSERLRYLDLSGNRLTRMPDLTGCAALEEVNLLGQSFEAEAETAAGEAYAPEPAPELLFEAADDGAVALRLGDAVVLEESLAGFEAGGGLVDAAFLRRSGEYLLSITGYLDGELLGSYTYRLTVRGGLPVAGIAAVAAAAVLAAVLLIAALLRGRKTKINGENT
jgi:internalin A